MSWEQLIAIAQEQREYQREENEPPTACPNDGEPLKDGPHGELHCRFCGEIHN